MPGLDSGPDGFVDTAAAMTCVDLVVSVDTAPAHLAGALGVPTLILLKRLGSDWRWLYKREDTVWYPSVRLFRQSAPGAWDELLNRVKQGTATSERPLASAFSKMRK
jgi:ADP-heptose:LPS heptosyltransferase